MRVLFLGTGGSLPTPQRSMPAIAVRRENELLLLDCGEGAQAQMSRCGLSPLRVSAIFLTHLHGDHFLGLAGLVQTMALMGRTSPLQVYCPAEDEDKVWEYLRLPRYTLTFDVSVEGLRADRELRRGGYSIRTCEVIHPVPAVAYSLVENERRGRFYPERAMSLGVMPGPDFSRLQRGETIKVGGRSVSPSEVMGPPRPGRKIVYTGDTRPSEKIAEFARNADLLVHDSTFSADMRDKAEESSHSTTEEAAEIARRAGVRLLALFHISPRYPDASVLLEEARRIFPETILPEDLSSIDIPLRENEGLS
ncbi:MAG: ribonuclease Z [Candidatus Hadarchaeales archaeon]